ncbi:MAG TPA: hypothetical protein H9745_06550 [Candidatus Agathobaculum stercoravium]|nr:hypothetical protein [Candidatus Agathobaculum stercoravium]
MKIAGRFSESIRAPRGMYVGFDTGKRYCVPLAARKQRVLALSAYFAAKPLV